MVNALDFLRLGAFISKFLWQHMPKLFHRCVAVNASMCFVFSSGVETAFFLELQAGKLRFKAF